MADKKITIPINSPGLSELIKDLDKLNKDLQDLIVLKKKLNNTNSEEVKATQDYINTIVKLDSQIDNLSKSISDITYQQDLETKSTKELTTELDKLIKKETELSIAIDSVELGSDKYLELTTNLIEVNKEIENYVGTLESKIPGATKILSATRQEFINANKAKLGFLSVDNLVSFASVAVQSMVGLNEAFAQVTDSESDAAASILRIQQALVTLDAIRDTGETIFKFKQIIDGAVVSMKAATKSGAILAAGQKLVNSVFSTTGLIITALVASFAYLLSISDGLTNFLEKFSAGFKALFRSIATGSSYLDAFNRELEKIAEEKNITRLGNQFAILTANLSAATNESEKLNRTAEERVKLIGDELRQLHKTAEEQLEIAEISRRRALDDFARYGTNAAAVILQEKEKEVAEATAKVKATELKIAELNNEVKREGIEIESNANDTVYKTRLKIIENELSNYEGASNRRLKLIKAEGKTQLDILNNELSKINQIAYETGETAELKIQKANLVSQITQQTSDNELKVAQELKAIEDARFEQLRSNADANNELNKENSELVLNTESKLLDIEEQLIDIGQKRAINDALHLGVVENVVRNGEIELDTLTKLNNLQIKRITNAYNLQKNETASAKNRIKNEKVFLESQLESAIKNGDDIKQREISNQISILDEKTKLITNTEDANKRIFEETIKFYSEKYTQAYQEISEASKRKEIEIKFKTYIAPIDPKATADLRQKVLSETLDAFKGLASEFANLSGAIIDILNSKIDIALSKISDTKDKAEQDLEVLQNDLDNAQQRIKDTAAEAKEATGQRADFLNAQLEREIESRNKVEASIQAQQAAIKGLEGQEEELQKKREQNARVQARIQALALAAQSALALANSITAITNTAGQTGVGAVIAVPAVIGVIAAGIATITSLVSAAKTFEHGGLLEGPSHLEGGIKGTGRFNNVEVEGGEFIVNKRATKQFLPMLESINRYQNGGILQASSIENIIPQQAPLQLGIVDVVQGLNRIKVIDNLSSI